MFTDGGMHFEKMEMHKRDLLREAKLERLAREAQEDQPRIQKGWLRLISDVIVSTGATLKEKTTTTFSKEGRLLPDSPDNGLEPI